MPYKLQKRPYIVLSMCSHAPRAGGARSIVAYDVSSHELYRSRLQARARLLYAIPGTPDGLFNKFEGSVIDIKPAAPVSVDTTVNIKA